MDELEQEYLMIIDRIRGYGMPQEAEARIPVEVEAIYRRERTARDTPDLP